MTTGEEGSGDVVGQIGREMGCGVVAAAEGSCSRREGDGWSSGGSAEEMQQQRERRENERRVRENERLWSVPGLERSVLV